MTRVTWRRPIHTLLLACSLAVVAWGTLAFGAVYPWAYRPLAIGCAVLGAVVLLVERHGRPAIGRLAAGLFAVALSIGLQLIPVPAATMARLNPGGDEFLRRYDLAYGAQPATPVAAAPAGAATGSGSHPLSISPEHTVLGLSLYVPLALFFLGLTRLLSVTGARSIARFLAIFGVGMALVGIAQYELTAQDPHPLVYGFWKPKYESRPFGPFINPNHFAGWMLMALPVTLGLFYDTLSQAIEEASAYAKNRIELAASPQMGAIILLGFSAIVMGLALMMTRSRSGIASFAVGTVLGGWVLWRRQKNASGRLAVVALWILLFGGTAMWAGPDTFFSKFADPVYGTDIGSFGGRVGAWKDTLRMIRAAPLTGMGLNTYGTAMILYQTGNANVHFQESHNDYLQIAAEGGLLVAVPALCTLGIFVMSIRRRFAQSPRGGTTYWIRVGAVIGLIGIALQSLVEFSLQMPGNAALFALIAALAVHQSPNLKRE